MISAQRFAFVAGQNWYPPSGQARGHAFPDHALSVSAGGREVRERRIRIDDFAADHGQHRPDPSDLLDRRGQVVGGEHREISEFTRLQRTALVVVVRHEGRIAGVHLQRLTAAWRFGWPAALHAADSGAVEIPLERYER